RGSNESDSKRDQRLDSQLFVRLIRERYQRWSSQLSIRRGESTGESGQRRDCDIQIRQSKPQSNKDHWLFLDSLHLGRRPRDWRARRNNCVLRQPDLSGGIGAGGLRVRGAANDLESESLEWNRCVERELLPERPSE